MKATTVIIALSSIGFIVMGLFIMYSKKISKFMTSEENLEKGKRFIRQNAYINITVGIFGIIISILDYILNKSNLILIISFISIIFIASIIQSNLAKKFRQ